MDAPLTPAADGRQSDLMYLTGTTQAELQRLRDEVLSCDKESIRALAPYLEAVFETDYRSALGDEDMIEKERDLFKEIKAFA